MESSRKSIDSFDIRNPSSPEQQALVAAMNEAYVLLEHCYDLLVEEGLLETELGSQGVANALGRLTAEHLACHSLNAAYNIDDLDPFIEGYITTLRRNFSSFRDTYSQARIEQLQSLAEKETKQ
jgi:hypothetical protein